MKAKERLFVSHYLGKAQGNGTLAATLAGYNHPAQLAYQLLKKLHIREAIETKLARVAMESDEVLARLADRARADAGDFLTFGPPAPDSHPWLDLHRARRRGSLGNLRKIKQTTRTISRGEDLPPEEERTIEVEIHDAMPALALLAKFHGLDKLPADGVDVESMSDEELDDLIDGKGKG